jgi:hypothetical protein
MTVPRSVWSGAEVALSLVLLLSAPVASQSPAPAEEDSEVHWQTDRVDLRADGIALQLGDLTFSPEGAEVTLIEDVHARGFWYLYATWTVDGHESILRLRFRSRPPDWYLDTIGWAVSDLVMPDGRRAMGSFAGDARDLTRTAPGRPFSGDLSWSTEGHLAPCPGDMSEAARAPAGVTASLALEGLQLSVTPRERSWPDKALRAIGHDDLLDPQISRSSLDECVDGGWADRSD